MSDDGKVIDIKRARNGKGIDWKPHFPLLQAIRNGRLTTEQVAEQLKITKNAVKLALNKHFPLHMGKDTAQSPERLSALNELPRAGADDRGKLHAAEEIIRRRVIPKIPLAVRTLVALMKTAHPRERVAAAKIVLEYALGGATSRKTDPAKDGSGSWESLVDRVRGNGKGE